MCGIAGFTGVDQELLSRMLDSMVHRGPDGFGIEVNEHFSMGMRRLAIIDVDGGNQPIYTDDHRLALISNSEIYNAPELRVELESRGHRFSTDHSDTEVILRGYEEWGQDVVSHLTGMFAFALWDSTHKELFLARDRLGIKPLYYAQHGNRVIFASEIKAILQDPLISRRENLQVLQRFLLLGTHDDTGDTFFEGIKRVPPAHTMAIGPEGIRAIRRYWNPEVNLEFSGGRRDDDYAAEFAALFDRVVSRHLLSDVPVGAALSGGLASTGVVGTMAQLVKEGADLHTGGTLRTFSAVFPGGGNDESRYIHEVEQSTATDAYHAQPDLDEFWLEMQEWIWFQEEPTISSAPYSYYCMYRLAGEHVKVVLSGSGGAELLAADGQYFSAYLSSARDQGHWLVGVRGLLSSLDVHRGLWGDALRSHLPGRERPASVAPLLTDGDGGRRQRTPVPDRNLNARLAHDVLARSTPNLLRYEDRNSMAFSVEARVPFLDHELVEFIFKLPIDQKIDGGWNRAIYRRALRDRVPELNRRRRSRVGFTNPEVAWIRGRAARMRAIFDSATCRARGIYDNDHLVKSLDAWLAGHPSDPLVFWRTMVTELWMQRYLDQPVGVAA